ncbi:hypothetical protein RvY_03662 [Ramazzottius varieornatus]|uniref:Secreted protein n=1 Tax=Ramazzottius varieornatus TaxID=947166 RepID=A0A1D1UNW8_RAMVA|nr:hypothetical protein RvY_03662 [Ramazzottius varieornatus]
MAECLPFLLILTSSNSVDLVVLEGQARVDFVLVDVIQQTVQIQASQRHGHISLGCQQRILTVAEGSQVFLRVPVSQLQTLRFTFPFKGHLFHRQTHSDRTQRRIVVDGLDGVDGRQDGMLSSMSGAERVE